jgi:hypothetical protein
LDDATDEEYEGSFLEILVKKYQPQLERRDKFS